jgi:hypothetical protein
MRNPWLAIDSSTSPVAKAREVRLARERFLEDRGIVSGLRSPIVDSWRRSAELGVDPSRWTAPLGLDEREAQERLAEHPLGRLAPILHQSLAAVANEAEHLVAVSDADGLLLSVEGDPGVRARAEQEMGFAAGAQWGEQAVGTNEIGTALAADHAVQEELLRDGEVGEAVARYRGPMLPRSEAPGVADLRDELDGWTRRAVLASDDLEALWTWLTTPSGEDDMQAWKRFLSSVPPEDGRRGLAAVRLERLRSLAS